jgi:hypothetical protein
LITTVWVKQEVSQCAAFTASGALPTIRILFNAVLMKNKECHCLEEMLRVEDVTLMNLKNGRFMG